MSISIYNIKKWTNMLLGKSMLHVEQGIGKVYSIDEIKGYYNDLTEKVTKDKEIYSNRVPIFDAPNGEKVFFPISIFQYGLGAYDLYLLEKKQLFLEKFTTCAEWALNNQNDNGSWDTFSFIYPSTPYSAMSQGEGASLLIRAYIELNDKKYLEAAKRAIDFMISSEESGGTARYQGNEIYFLEVTNKPVILNGWIFSLFGLYDFIKIVKTEEYIITYKKSVNTLVKHIKDYDTGYWSKYNDYKMIASKFYHKLHIAQLSVLYEITGEAAFLEILNKWKKYLNNFFISKMAFAVKAFQKIVEK